MLARKSWANRIWMATGKRIYNFITRCVLGYMDREGVGEVLRTAPLVAARIAQHAGVSAAFVVPYPTAHGVRLYAFVEARTPLKDEDMRGLFRSGEELPMPGLIQTVSRLPRGMDGRVREDALRLVAQNQIDLLDHLSLDSESRHSLAEIVEQRLNRSDRRLQF
jgi:hypothetical protein